MYPLMILAIVVEKAAVWGLRRGHKICYGKHNPDRVSRLPVSTRDGVGAFAIVPSDSTNRFRSFR